MESLDHRTDTGLVCPITGKATRYAWTDHGKPNSCNSCEHCAGEAKTLGGMLHEVNERRKRTKKRP